MTDAAPGWPGIRARWTSSSKCGVGTAFSLTSRVWFTLSHGILNEIYYPREDQACTRDLGLIVTDGKDFFSEEKRHTRHQVGYLADGVPAFHLVNTCCEERYLIEKDIFTDPQRDALLQRICFKPIKGKLADYRLYALLAPHLGNHGGGNSAWIDCHNGVLMLFAERDGLALALACSAPWARASAGFVGFSDGWQDLASHKHMTWTYQRAENGNVALTGEVDLNACGGRFVLALGFGTRPAEAGHRALAALLDDFESTRDEYLQGWQGWQQTLLPLERLAPSKRDLYRVSTAVLRTHVAKSLPGGIIASLSIPWGFTKGDDDLGGYHLVWPRDLVETAGGLLAARVHEEVRRVLHYLHVTQQADGHWPQNMWTDGVPYWNGIQMDETALPILLVDMALREGALEAQQLVRLWPMVQRAASYLVRNGPVTQQDRWETSPGYSPFTLAAEIAALLAAADLAERVDQSEVAGYLRETADAWNCNIERWTYVTGSDTARKAGAQGYYVCTGTPERAQAASPQQGYVPIKSRFQEHGGSQETSIETGETGIVSPDALALVRFGLRAADDPRIVETVKAIDATLRVDTPSGPAWRRYQGDQYGEHEDGSPFDGSGIGRAWPLLTGERAHYELAAGRRDEAERLLHAMEAFAGEGGLMPEQVWDAPDIPEKGLFCGRPSGSAMPLVWAQAEYVKLRRSLQDGRVFDTPPQAVQRYLVQKTGSPHAVWRFNQKCFSMPAGKTLRIETLARAVVHWSSDGWQSVQDSDTRDTGLGVHLCDLPTGHLSSGSGVTFTFCWPEVQWWEGKDFSVSVE